MSIPHRRLTLLSAIAAALFVPATALAQSVPAPAPAPYVTIEMRLATVEEDGEVSALDPLIDQFAEMLDNLEARCAESREQLGNQALIAYSFASMDDADITPMRILQRVRSSIPPAATFDKPAVCGGYFTRFTTRPAAMPAGDVGPASMSVGDAETE